MTKTNDELQSDIMILRAETIAFKRQIILKNDLLWENNNSFIEAFVSINISLEKINERLAKLEKKND